MRIIGCAGARKTFAACRATLLTLACLFSLGDVPAAAYTDSELAKGFFETVFGAEYKSWGWRSDTVKKFIGPVRFYIDNRAAIDRREAVAEFVGALPKAIAGLDVELVTGPAAANFRVFVVDREQYRDVVRNEIYQRQGADVPGLCLVRVVSAGRGIRRSDAVIVSDEGEVQFRRCLVEEVLQGLGPVNDSPDLVDSVFNDTSTHIDFTRHDRLILNMLYDPRIRAGMTRRDVAGVLPLVIRDARQRVR